MTPALLAVAGGLALMLWSAERFVEGAAATARRFGMPSLLVGMLIIGFGTSAPEIAVSVLAAAQGNPGLAIGNAYGSNIANIGLVLGVTALLRPLAVHSSVLRRELPLLLGATALAAWQLLDGRLGRGDAACLLAAFVALLAWTIVVGIREHGDAFARETEIEIRAHPMSQARALGWLAVGLVLLVASSRILVWGAVDIATRLGISDLVIGLTVVGIGTSLPELASSVIAARKGEHELALGNVLGSNLFNTLAVVGIAGLIAPSTVDPVLLERDVAVMAGLSVALTFFAAGWRRAPGRINRIEGALLLGAFVVYLAVLAGGSGIA